ncbi:MAG: hypothetical protein WA742_13215, partial [Candidatus Cybelea sp.]
MYPNRKFAGSKELLKLQAEGKILSPLTSAAAKWVYDSVASGARPPFHTLHSRSTPAMWLSSTGYS